MATLLKWLEAGDVLVVTRLDRSTRDLLNILDTIGKAGAAKGLRSIRLASHRV
jgi:DNA invertase Pin-like site-specific DNA recombinase